MRTVLGTANQSKLNGKWAITLETYSVECGHEYLSSRTVSASVFITEEEAYAGGKRALEILETTGMFPNMCETF
jgi:hypothetical protein